MSWATVCAMPFWSCAQLEPCREKLALHCLQLAGFTAYSPRVKSERRANAPLFPGYCFVWIELQWHAVRWAPGIVRLVQGGGHEPARLPAGTIEALKSREGPDGLIVLPKVRGLQRGDQVRISAGAFAGHLGLYDGMRPRDRVAVLLALLGGQTRVEMARRDVSPA